MVSDLQWLDFLTFWLCESDLVSVETMLCIWDFDLFPGSWCAGRCSLVVWGRGSEWQLHPPWDHTRPWGCLQCAASPAFVFWILCFCSWIPSCLQNTYLCILLLVRKRQLSWVSRYEMNSWNEIQNNCPTVGQWKCSEHVKCELG